MANDTDKVAQELQPIDSMESLTQFLRSIEDIKHMDDEQKYAHVFLIICKFLDLCRADNNLISGVSINLMISVVFGEAKGNTAVAKDLMLNTVIPVFQTVANDLENCETVKIVAPKGFSKSNLH